MTDFFADLEAQLADAHARRPSHRRPAVAAAVAVVAVVGVAVALALSLTGERGGQRSASTLPTPATGAAGIAVLNGTRAPGLGARVAQRLAAEGFRIAIVDDAPRRAVARTTIAFRRGAAETAGAVAARLRIKAIRRGGAGLPAPIVVTLGADATNGIVGAPPPAASFRLVGSGRAAGSAFIRHEDRKDVLIVRGQGLRRSNQYGVWLTGDRDSFLGFAPPPRGGRMDFSNVLPGDDRSFRRLLITRETDPQPSRPGKTVLSGTLRFP